MDENFEALSDAQKAELISEVEMIQAEIEAKSYLAQTDWYVIRLNETGEPIPDNVLEQRAAARLRASRN